MVSVDRPDLSPLLDITHVALLLGVEVRHVRRLVAERRIPFIKWGHLLRFDQVELRTWVDAHRHGPGVTPSAYDRNHPSGLAVHSASKQTADEER